MTNQDKTLLRSVCKDSNIERGSIELAWGTLGYICITVLTVGTEKFLRRNIMGISDDHLLTIKKFMNLRGYFVAEEILRVELQRRCNLGKVIVSDTFLSSLRAYTKKPETDFLQIRIGLNDVN